MGIFRKVVFLKWCCPHLAGLVIAAMKTKTRHEQENRICLERLTFDI